MLANLQSHISKSTPTATTLAEILRSPGCQQGDACIEYPQPRKRYSSITSFNVKQCLLAVLLFANPMRAADPTTPPIPPEEDLIISNWSVTTSLTGAGGYRDNVLLSPTQPAGSGFFRGQLEAMFITQPSPQLEGYVFLDITDLRFFSVPESDHETAAFITSDFRWKPETNYALGLTALLYHYDQVFDVSVTEIDLDTAQLQATGFKLSPNARWNIQQYGWLEIGASGEKVHYANDLDKYDEGEGMLRLGRSWGHGSEFSLMGAKRSRAHETREQYTSSGRPIDGTRLKVKQTQLSAQLTYFHDEKKQWRSALALTMEQSRDNGSGYFDYDREILSAGLAWMPENWELRLSVGLSKYDFLVQEVGIGITPEFRHKDELRLTMEVARQLKDNLALVASYEGEWADSNDDRSSFRVNTVYLGLRWNWENLGIKLPEL